MVNRLKGVFINPANKYKILQVWSDFVSVIGFLSQNDTDDFLIDQLFRISLLLRRLELIWSRKAGIRIFRHEKMKYNSQESNYLNPSFPNYSKHVKGELHKSKAVAMASDLCNQQQQLNSSLMRYPSAPSSLLENLINSNGDGCDDFSMFATFMSCGGRNFVSSHPYDNGEKTSALSQSSGPQFLVPNHRSADDVGIESSCRNIMAMDSEDVMKSTSSNCFNLISHGSSPAGLFSHMNVENGMEYSY